MPREIWFDDGRLLMGIKEQSDELFYEVKAKRVTVIGNIHDNPELLNQW